MPHPPDPAAPAMLTVVVERSGGFAGLTRRWSVDAGASDRSAWDELLDRCVWSGRARSAPAGADRFSWVVSADDGNDRRRAELAESELDTAWRALIDAVRAADAAAPSAGAPPEQ